MGPDCQAEDVESERVQARWELEDPSRQAEGWRGSSKASSITAVRISSSPAIFILLSPLRRLFALNMPEYEFTVGKKPTSIKLAPYSAKRGRREFNVETANRGGT